MSLSQAPLCHCTLRTVTKRAEGTFRSLRYSFGGDHPSQTTHQTRFPGYPGLGPKLTKSGISLLPPFPPRGEYRRLPPILRIASPGPVSSCSKAPRGLFVLSRVTRIFTGASISPGPSSRQRPDRYAFRAGRNLPDKEFRYLRTVIVTAAVYRGFGSELSLLPLTFRHWAGISPYTSTRVLAGTCVFVKQSPGPFLCDPHILGVPLLPKLRG